jgi:hypothetical protein
MQDHGFVRLQNGIAKHNQAACVRQACLIQAGDTHTDSARLDRIAPGTPLRISRGPLAGLTGVCVTSTRERVRVLLDVMGGAPADVAADAVSVEG